MRENNFRIEKFTTKALDKEPKNFKFTTNELDKEPTGVIP